MAPRVAVIGAGPLGLMALKNMREDGFDVTCYEARPYVGGLWNYSEDEKLSVAEGTIFNSSRHRSAISDYPFPDDTDDFPTWKQMWTYLEGYADHFNLRPHIQLNSPITGLSREGKKWIVEITPKNGTSRRESFDKVAVAIGSFITPKTPKMTGIEKFAGRTLHSVNFHQPKTFKDQRVLLVGLHASSQDVAVGLEPYASQVYVTHRNGVTLLPRYDPKGATFDQAMNLTFSKFQMFMQTWFPTFFNWMIDQLIVSMSKKAFPKVPASWKLSPAPSMATTAPLIADDLWPLMESGFCEPVAKVSEVTGPKSVELSDGRILEDIDAIIYCTGYDMETPFVEKEHNPYPVRSAPAELYRGTFPLHEDPEVRNSLAFLGHSAVPFPGFVQHELIGMAVSQIWQGKTLLPSLGEMKKWHQGFLKWRNDLLRKQKSPATFYVAFMPFTDHITWFDQAAGTDVWSHFGMFSWNAWSFWWSDRAFYRKCASGLFSPAIWRLFETGKRKTWPQAKEQVYIDNEIAEKQIKDRAEKLKAAEDKKTQ